METLSIEILNPKAINIIQGLAELNLIHIKKENKDSEFLNLLKDLRSNSALAPTIEEITAEVESVRNKRYEE